jgi:lipopolysaccharide export system protein LptA
MKQRPRLCAFVRMVLAAVLAAPGFAAAQGPHAAATGPIQGLVQDQNQDQPIQIEATTLEVRDKSKTATFSGDVQVVQGDTTIKCQTLVVFYGGRSPGAGEKVASASQSLAAAAAQGGRQQTQVVPQGAQDITRIEASGGVTVVSKDQNASGDMGVYDLKKKTITLTGNVVVSQGKNVLHGDRVVVDTITGNAHIESGPSSQNRVRALILPNKNENGSPSNVLSIGPGPNKPN